ncbi:MAG: phage holin family protein [Bradyrhizobium sp.]|uniref:phage holin family protein n=1 Tax=Bradyrhizobium sp. TaxID=376 RepID=UPI0025B925E6|nr:phage holin family protein [Bradyrhizobium sp.]MBI5261189.1 phage holin family protein [Bradyrhizobium sp.]
MLAPSGDLLRAGLGLKLNQVRRAARSYLRDRAGQATGTATAYAVAAGLFAAAGIFVLAACLVGLAALFRWVELNFGTFWAFGAVGALLLIVAAICAAIGLARLHRPAKEIPSLANRLRVAIASYPIPRGTVKEAVKEVATSIPLAPLAPGERGPGRAGMAPSLRDSRMQLGLMLFAGTLLGWAVTRRRRRPVQPGRRMDA